MGELSWLQAMEPQNLEKSDQPEHVDCLLFVSSGIYMLDLHYFFFVILKIYMRIVVFD